MVQEVVRKGMNALRRFFTGRKEDRLEINGSELWYVADGKRGVTDARELAQVSLQQSFLGLFGTNLKIQLLNENHVLIRGLENDRAKLLEQQAREAQLECLTMDLKEGLDSTNQRIVDGFHFLQRDEYLSAYEINEWASEFADLQFLAAHDESVVRQAGASQEALLCHRAMVDPLAWRAERNDRWIDRAMKQHAKVLDSTSKVSLTAKQKEAVLRHDNRVLVVAGAGTGKTTTVVSKVHYLLATQWCRPDEILCLSFNRGVKEEIQSRLENQCGTSVPVHTFHSLGLEIITVATGSKPAIFDQELRSTIESILVQLLKIKTKRARLLGYLIHHYFPPKPEYHFETRQAYLQYASRHDFTTLKGERVKSNGEVQVANWLYLNGVNYDYEAKYREADTGTKKKRVYAPDFLLPDYGIYIEHFGIDRDGGTASYVDAQEYKQQMQWKRDLHDEYGTVLVETYAYESWEGSLPKALEKRLFSHGVTFTELSDEELDTNGKIQQQMKRVAGLIATALTLFRSDSSSLADLEANISAAGSPERGRAFLKIFSDVLHAYEKLLGKNGQVDFGDMILRAAGHVEAGEYRSPFRAIVVDEFQDISQGRAWLVNALLEQVEDSRLLCVGDDWQSIYRFTGSDVGLMTRFESDWSQALRVDLDYTFRFSKRLEELSTTFVTQNPTQLRKVIQCREDRDEPVVHVVTAEVSDLLEDIGERSPGARVLILGRYNFSLPKQVASDGVGSVECLTVHKAKGREADYVIVNDMQSGTYGFPTEIEDDPLIGLFLTRAEEYPNAEERRLFYVALTRARQEVWLRVCPQRPSPFVQELVNDARYEGLVTCEPDAIVIGGKCPKCEGGLVLREGKPPFFGCMYYPRCRGLRPGCPGCGKSLPRRVGSRFQCPSPKCSWQSGECLECGEGYAVKKSGKYGPFFGCSEYWTSGCDWKGSCCLGCGETLPERNGEYFRCPSRTCTWQARACPRCGKGFVTKRSGRRGSFFGCSMYSKNKCKWTGRATIP